MNEVRRAVLSVSDKAGILALASGLAEMGVEIVSTGGTAAALGQAGITIVPVSDLTRFPEMLDGRVKTLHPAVHGGILARRDDPAHMSTIAEYGVAPIDLVCVNLYPFEETVARPDVSLDDAIENIDIGGPAMVRSAAKNHASVTVIVDPSDYGMVLDEMRSTGGETTVETRRRLAAKAFAHTARYDAMIAGWLRPRFSPSEQFPTELTLPLRRVYSCRYGENPHQAAAFYREPSGAEPCVGRARVLNGKELSFNNINDANAALEAVKDLTEGPAAVIIKHTNPCGAAIGGTLSEAFAGALESDPVSAFGGILAVNRELDADTADAITGKNTFFEVIIAPSYGPGALEVLTERKRWGADLRLLEVGRLEGWRDAATGYDVKKVVGGMLVQSRDLQDVSPDSLQTVTRRAPTADEIAELLFAWRIVRHAKSNAIVFTRNRRTVGVGAGQMNRVRSVRLAVEQAGDKARGAVMASDAFFPFPDGPEAAAAAGITAIIQPGGSKRDADTLAVCDENGIAMVYTGVRHFRH